MPVSTGLVETVETEPIRNQINASAVFARLKGHIDVDEGSNVRAIVTALGSVLDSTPRPLHPNCRKRIPSMKRRSYATAFLEFLPTSTRTGVVSPYFLMLPLEGFRQLQLVYCLAIWQPETIDGCDG